MDKVPRDPGPAATLREVTTSRIVSVSVDTTPDDISQAQADWVVVRGEDQGIVGLITPATAAKAAGEESINYLAQRTHFEVVPADLELGRITRSPIAPALLVVTGLVVAVDHGQPVGVWAGHNQYVLLNRVDQDRFGPPGIVIGESSVGGWNELRLSRFGGPTDITTLGIPGLFVSKESCQYVEPGESKECGWVTEILSDDDIPDCANPRAAEGYQPHKFVRRR